MENLLFQASLAAFVLGAFLYIFWIVLGRDILEYSARWSLGAAALALSLGLIVRWSIAGRPPLTNLYESLIVFAISLSAIFLAVARPYGLKNIGLVVTVSNLILLICATRLDSSIRPLMPALKSNWLVAHVLTCFIAYASLTLSFVCSVVFLLAERKGKTALCEQMDAAGYKTIAFGFLFLAVGIITGAVWAESAWGRYWGWDPKETWALITWLIYGFYLHMRVSKGWKGKAGSWISIAGFLAVIFTYVGVTFLLPGLHSYAMG